MKQIVFSIIYLSFLSCQIAEVLANENANGFITPRIINGGNADLNTHSYTLSLRLRGIFFCVAFAIDERNVFTAGHCFANNPELIPPYTEAVTVHSNTLGSYELGRIHEVEYVNIHPEFGAPWAPNMLHDIAHVLLKDDTKLELGPGQLTLKLPEADVVNGVRGTLTGWGCTDRNNPMVPAQQLQVLQLGILDWTHCGEHTRRRLFKEQLCGIRDQGAGCTEGDSGGPLVVEGVAVGIRSWCEAECVDGFPEFFTNVYQERRFIRTAMGLDPDDNPPPNNSPSQNKRKLSNGGESSKEKKSSWFRRWTCTAK